MIGKMLYLMRQRKHLSQDELADILGIARNKQNTKIIYTKHNHFSI